MIESHYNALRALVDLKDAIVVDVGCGTGGWVRRLAREGAHPIGIEASPYPLRVAQHQPKINGERYVEGRGEALPLDDGSADLVTFLFSLHHVPVGRQSDALREARRVVRQGGRVHVIEPLALGPYFEVLRLIDDETDIRKSALEALAEAPALGLKPLIGGRYDHIEHFVDFDDFRERVILVDHQRTTAFDANQDRVRAAFDAHAEAGPKGVQFIQPVRVFHFARVEKGQI